MFCTLFLAFHSGGMPSTALSNVSKQGFQFCTSLGVQLSEAKDRGTLHMYSAHFTGSSRDLCKHLQDKQRLFWDIRVPSRQSVSF